MVENLPAGEVKDEYTKLMSLIMQKVQAPEARVNAGEEGEIMPFPVENRLCSIFPEIVLPLGDHIRTRIFFCLPHVKKPDITPKF